jgi:hypothetical protein
VTRANPGVNSYFPVANEAPAATVFASCYGNLPDPQHDLYITWQAQAQPLDYHSRPLQVGAAADPFALLVLISLAGLRRRRL